MCKVPPFLRFYFPLFDFVDTQKNKITTRKFCLKNIYVYVHVSTSLDHLGWLHSGIHLWNSLITGVNTLVYYMSIYTHTHEHYLYPIV